MTPFARAYAVLADAQMSGALGDPTDPFAPTARWHVSEDVFAALKEQMQRDVLGPHERVAEDVTVTLYGWPLEVDEDAPDDVLELRIRGSVSVWNDRA